MTKQLTEAGEGLLNDGVFEFTYRLEMSRRKCQQKKGYGTLQLALNAGWLLAFKHRTRYSAYHCPHCGKHHLSTQVGRTTALACVL